MQISGTTQAAATTATTQNTKAQQAENEKTDTAEQTLQDDSVNLSDEAVALSGSGGGVWPPGKKPE